MTLIIDDDGNVRSPWESADEKLEAVKKTITPELIRLKERFEANENSVKPRQLNFNSTITQTLFIAFNKFKSVPYSIAIHIDVDTLNEYIRAYMGLMEYIKQYYPDFIGSKTVFSAFLGITASAYSALLSSSDPDVSSEMEMLNDKLCELEIVSAQSGINAERSTETKLRADTVGYGVNLKPNIESVTIKNTMSLDNDSVRRQLERVFGVLPEAKPRKKK